MVCRVFLYQVDSFFNKLPFHTIISCICPMHGNERCLDFSTFSCIQCVKYIPHPGSPWRRKQKNAFWIALKWYCNVIQWNPDFSNLQGKPKLGSKNRIVREIRDKITEFDWGEGKLLLVRVIGRFEKMRVREIRIALNVFSLGKLKKWVYFWSISTFYCPFFNPDYFYRIYTRMFFATESNPAWPKNELKKEVPNQNKMKK